MLLDKTPRRAFGAMVAVAIFAWVGGVRAADLDPKLNPAAIAIQMPKDVKWVESPDGSASAVLLGDPTKPGLYISLLKWHPHHNSKPHYHPNDRYLYVVSGTWWVATGTDYDLNKMVPLHAGSFVTHFGKQIHWDGAKDEECVLELVGMGPSTMIPADQKK